MRSLNPSLKLLTILAALVGLATAPLTGQTANDSARVLVDSSRIDLRRYCRTTKPVRYVCPIDTLRLAKASALLVASPVPVPTPIPTPTPTPTPVVIGNAELPRVFLNTALSATPSTGRTLRVASGGNLQLALDTAKAGDRLVLDSCARFVGNFVWRPKAGADSLHWVTITTAGRVPAEGTRISPDSATAMCYPKLVAAVPSEGVLLTEGAASFLRVIGVEIALPSTATINYGMVRLGASGAEQNTLAQVPHHIILDRVYVHGTATANVQRCVAFNGASLAVVDSYLSECHFAGADAQAVGGWNGPGPFKIVNNYLEASGENILFGGADPSISGLVPSDIEVRRNWIYKPLAWKGTTWTVKTLLECKNCQRLLVEANVLENCWTMGQNGHAILTQALTDNNTAPWTTTKDITIRFNIIKNAEVGYDIVSRVAYNTGGTVPLLPDSASRRISVTNNLWLGIAPGNLFGIYGDLQHVHLSHNTATATGQNAIAMFDAVTIGTGLRFTDNIASHGSYGIFGSSAGEGNPALAHYAPDGVIAGNVLIGVPSWIYPTNNLFPATVTDVGFSADWSLSATSAYKGKATDGKDPGADIAAILAAVAGVVRP